MDDCTPSMNREVTIDTPDLFSVTGEPVDEWAGSLREVKTIATGGREWT